MIASLTSTVLPDRQVAGLGRQGYCRRHGNVREETMKQARKRPPIKSREWIEAECLRIAQQADSRGAGIQRVTIRRLRPIPDGPNWKVADIIPIPPDIDFIGRVRAAIAHLPGVYSLEDE